MGSWRVYHYKLFIVEDHKTLQEQLGGCSLVIYEDYIHLISEDNLLRRSVLPTVHFYDFEVSVL